MNFVFHIEEKMKSNHKILSFVFQFIKTHEMALWIDGLIETWLSYYHELIITAMKMHFQKSKRSIITYRSYKKFDNQMFCGKLERKVIVIITQSNYLEKDGVDAFSFICCKVLNILKQYDSN